MNGYKIVLLKAILCFIGCRKVNGYAPEYVIAKIFGNRIFLVIYLWSQKSTRCFKISDIVSTILLQDAFRELKVVPPYS